jgi:SAM-dependent methyltransferase
MDDWDDYWSEQKKGNKRIYSIIAEKFRVNFIQPYLAQYVRKHFEKGSFLLHAGCGGGQVDLGIINDYAILPMDISKIGIELYKKFHPNCLDPIQCDIRKINLNNESVDGVISLGVLEHFSESEIINILQEFHRVLKPNGKVLLFWPPIFGVSVLFLNFWHFLLHKILRTNQKLHPDEISLLKSRTQVEAWVYKAGYKIIDYHFGPRDLFTQVVITLQKVSN